MKTFILFASMILTSMAFAAPATVPLDDESIDLAIELADSHPGTFSINGDCAKNEFTLTQTDRENDRATVVMSTGIKEYNLSDEDAAKVSELLLNIGVPAIDTGCLIKISKVTIVGKGCGFEEQKWTASFEE